MNGLWMVWLDMTMVKNGSKRTWMNMYCIEKENGWKMAWNESWMIV